MTVATLAQRFGDIRMEGQGHQIHIKQIVQIVASEVKSRPFRAASPYRGLEAFDEAHSGLFFGRDSAIVELVQAASQHPLLVISGASGSGKSSIVRAGLIPQLAQRVQGFRSFKMKPGSDPFASLKSALLSENLRDLGESEVAFAATTQSSVLACVAALRPPEECWLLLIDQFEEMFTLCGDPKKRDAFFDGLLSLSAESQEQFKIVLTMRSDFFDRFDPYPELLRQIRLGLRFVTSPTPDELRQCIEQPAAQHGVVFEDGLVEQILSELKGQPGVLPLLQYMLDRLWLEDKPANDQTLNKSSYVAIGGVKEALCQRANAVYARRKKQPRSQAEQQLMRRVFLRLVDFSGQGDSAQVVSRRRPLRIFSEAEQGTLLELVEEKLLTTNAEHKQVEQDAPSFEQATVEVAHETLLSAWSQLTEWIKEARQVLFVRNRLSHDADGWQHLCQKDPNHSRRSDEELWTGTRLTQAQELRERGDFDTVLGGLTPEEKAFLDASGALKARLEQDRARREQEAADQLQRERELAERNRQLLLDTYIERGYQRLFAEGKPGEALLWLHRAYKEGSRNPILPDLLREARNGVEAIPIVLDHHPGSLFLATYSPDGQRILTACGDLGSRVRVWEAGTGHLVVELANPGLVLSAAYSPDGQRIVTTSMDNTARVWEAETGRLVAELTGHGDRVNDAAYSPDSQHIVIASDDNTARVWEAETGRLAAELMGHQAGVNGARYSPDGQRIVTASSDHTARVWEAETRRLVAELTGHGSRVWSAMYSPDGHRVLTEHSDNIARVWEAKTGRLVAELRGHQASINGARYSPDGQRIVTASSDHTARIWQAETGHLVAELNGHQASVNGVRYSPDGQRIVTASDDKTVRVWEAETGRLVAEFTGHEDRVLSARYSPDGQRIVTASDDKTVRVWEAETGRLAAELVGHRSRVYGATYSPNGQRIVTASRDNTVRVWEVKTGHLVAELTGHGDDVNSATYSPDGQRIVTASDDKTVRVWEAETGRLVVELTGHESSVEYATYSPDSQRIVTASWDKSARVWEAETGRLVAELTGHEYSVKYAMYSPDGQRIVTASWSKSFCVWEAETGRLVAELTGHGDCVWSARYSPDGQCIVTASEDTTARVWEAKTGRLVAELTGHSGPVRSATYSPDGQRIVTASEDKTARVWEAKTGRLVAELTGHRAPVRNATYSPDGQRIVTASEDMTARVWDISPETQSADQISKLIRRKVAARFQSEDSNLIVPALPEPAELRTIP